MLLASSLQGRASEDEKGYNPNLVFVYRTLNVGMFDCHDSAIRQNGVEPAGRSQSGGVRVVEMLFIARLIILGQWAENQESM